MKLQNVLEHAGITAKENPDIEVDTTGKSIEETVEYIFSRLKKYL